MRVLSVGSRKELEQEVNNFIVAGYKTKQEVPGTSARVVKKKKVSAGFCILWFILGIVPLFIYLIYCAARKPQDDVLVKIEVRQAPTPTPTAPTNPQ